MGKGDASVIRFGVRNDDGVTSAVWRCWVDTHRGKDDIYLTTPSLNGAMKASLHESGSWQVGFSAEFARLMDAKGLWSRESRHIAIWPRPTEFAPGMTFAFRLVVPAVAVAITGRTDAPSKPVVWVPAPPPKRAIEFAILITAGLGTADGWPGKKSMDTRPVGNMPLGTGEYVWIVSRETEVPQFDPFKGGSMTRFTETLPDLSGSRVRAILFGSSAEGSRFIFETLLDPAAIPKLQKRLEDAGGE